MAHTLSAESWQKVMVLAVHPDDESLATGGLIQHALAEGAKVRVIVVTDGENNPWPQRVLERRWQIDASARARWGARRRVEVTRALECLGVGAENICFWNYPDQGLTQLLLEGGAELLEDLAAEICEWQPTLLVGPSPHDLHPDHSALAVLVRFSLQRPDVAAASPFECLDYLVHPRNRTSGAGLSLSLTPEQVLRKRRAILCHGTQVALCRRRFLAYAQPQENFLRPKPAAQFDPDHVRMANVSSGFVRLPLAPVGAGSRLLIAAETPHGPFRQSLRVPGGAHSELNRDSEAPGRECAFARDRNELLVPHALLSSTLAIKVAAGRRLYDRAGWRLISAAELATAAEDPSERPARAGRICCVIPCYDLEHACGPIVRSAAKFADHVIAVNDGSTDATGRVLKEIAAGSAERITVLDFSQNRGKGVVLLEAFRHALRLGDFDLLITLDGDGQHRPEDIPRLAGAVSKDDCALVIGERLARAKMPLRSRLGNSVTAVLLKLFYSQAPTDTQSGYRALRWDFVREVVATVEGGRYETELNILMLALRRHRRIGSVTIPTIYLDNNRLSHFRPLFDSWRIYHALFRG